MINKRSALPNFFTLTNIFLGFLSIIYTSQGRFSTAAWCLIFGTLCDQVDGRLARLSKVSSNFGKEIDSFADVISFGVAPAFLVYQTNFSTSGMWGALFCFIYILAGIFRLARYNVNTVGTKKKNYKGLPVPVAALALSSFFLMSQHFWGTVKIAHILLIMLPVLSFLMVTSMKFDTIPMIKPSKNLWTNIKSLFWISGIACIIINAKIWFFPWTVVYILVMVGEGIVDKIKEESEVIEEIEVTVDNE